MVGSTYYVSDRLSKVSEVIRVVVIAEWSDFVMVEGIHASGEDYLGVVSVGCLFQTETGAIQCAA